MASWTPDAEPRRHGKLALVLFAIAAAVLVVLVAANTARANAWNGVEAPALEAKLPTHVAVYCTTTDGSGSFADFPAAGIGLAGWACDLLQHGTPTSIFPRLQLPWAVAVYTLYHEWWHVAFHEHNEKLTDCGTWAVFPYVLRRYWNQTAATADRLYRSYAYRGGYAPLPCGFAS